MSVWNCRISEQLATLGASSEGVFRQVVTASAQQGIVRNAISRPTTERTGERWVERNEEIDSSRSGGMFLGGREHTIQFGIRERLNCWRGRALSRQC